LRSHSYGYAPFVVPCIVTGQHLCTAEVAARALGELDENTNRQLMEALVHAYCHRYLWARKGQRREDPRSLRTLEQYRSGAQ
ncbi:DTW domain-containing protein, partial [Endozoicomonas sp. YOMI1]|uniref:DTW domain-containing protein n=1 Tax=Endozoicomonas sp. YOMI1 TaxID=2828739 RepID=UPI0021479165